MKPRILLVNPPIYDFTAHNFWVRPYGLLRVAGQLRGQAEMRLFDYLEPSRPLSQVGKEFAPDRWGRSRFPGEPAAKPAAFAAIRRRYRRFAFLGRDVFRKFLAEQPPADVALVQTGMTYWYPGVAEVIEDIRARSRGTRIVLGGAYATLCPQHAQGLGADLVVTGADLAPLWRSLAVEPDPRAPALWEAYDRIETGVLKLTDGCPFRCTYCSTPNVYPRFAARPLDAALAEMSLLRELGARNVAFYDDALLFRPEETLAPFLDKMAALRPAVNFHTPNALHARLLTSEAARLLVRGGVRTFYLGFESLSERWQRATGAGATGPISRADDRAAEASYGTWPDGRPCSRAKVAPDELAQAVANLLDAGAAPESIAAYLILGHPRSDAQELEASMRFAHGLGVRVMLSDFSPIPGTPDGELCRRWVNLDEPLCHNKTAFPIVLLGEHEVNRLKELCRRLNREGRTGIHHGGTEDTENGVR